MKKYFIADLVKHASERNSIVNFLKRHKFKLSTQVRTACDGRPKKCLLITLAQINKALAINRSKVVFSQEIMDTLETMKKQVEVENGSKISR